MRLNVMGRAYNALTVGSRGWATHASVQAALASITDSAPDNPYAIIVQEPHIAGVGSIPDGALAIDTSHVVILAEPGAYIDRPAASLDDDFLVSGGTLFVAHRDDSTMVRDVVLYGLDVRRNITGTTGDGAPPEAAIFVGRDHGFTSFFPSTRVWDDVHIIGCTTWGVHDGIQWIGTKYDTADAVPPCGTQRFNAIHSAHDASTFKGNMRVWSVLNRIHSRGSGFPLLDNIDDWKTTGHHVNVDFPRYAASNLYDAHPLSMLVFDRDVIRVESDANTRAAPHTQSHAAGVLVYAPSSSPSIQANACPRIVARGLHVEVIHSQAVDVSTLAGFAVTFNEDHTAAENHQVADGRIVIDGGYYRVHQQSTDGAAPDEAHGLLLRGGANASGTKTVQASARFDVANDKGGGSAYGITSASTGDVVRHRATGAAATAGLNAVNGTITTLAEVA